MKKLANRITDGYESKKITAEKAQELLAKLKNASCMKQASERRCTVNQISYREGWAIEAQEKAMEVALECDKLEI